MYVYVYVCNKLKERKLEYFDNRTQFVSKMEALKHNSVSWEVNDDLQFL